MAGVPPTVRRPDDVKEALETRSLELNRKLSAAKLLISPIPFASSNPLACIEFTGENYRIEAIVRGLHQHGFWHMVVEHQEELRKNIVIKKLFCKIGRAHV